MTGFLIGGAVRLFLPAGFLTVLTAGLASLATLGRPRAPFHHRSG